MLNLKVSRECDQALQEDHDLPLAMFGLESHVEKVEALVTSNDADPLYVGVTGMGGVGKTLLLQRVYRSPRVHCHFQGAKFIWLTVGQTPDVMTLYRTLSAELGVQDEKTLNADDYKSKLLFQFKQKRVFLVLDDVWKDKAFNSLDLAKGEGSATLLSTRNLPLLEVANPEMSQVYITPLEKVDSWRLFCVHAFRPPSNVPCELEALAHSMAEECKGLPLALKVVGRAMFRKPLRQWEPLLKKLKESRMQERTVEEELYERLKVGYDLLSEDDCRLKQCFHFFAAFPEDSEIVFEEILFHWIGEGLVPAHDGDDPTEDAFSLLKKLWERSFIESNGQFGSDVHYLLNFKVHDVMRDLAFYLLEKDSGTPPARQLYVYRAGQNLDKVPKECTTLLEALRLSFDMNKLEALPDCFYAPKLVSLLLGGNPIASLPANFSSNFPKLSVLNLRDGQFLSLPEELGDLKNLVSLDLSDCLNLESLPDTIQKLHELKFLILDGCRSLRYLPSGVGGLRSLQVLHIQCENLIWAEYMTREKSWDGIYPTVGASLENICELVLLTELTISTSTKRHGRFLWEYGMMDKVGLKVNNICALTKLKLLNLYLNIKTLPAEMAYRFIQLQKLDLCSHVLEYLPRSFTSCGAFPALITLRLYCLKLIHFPEVDEGALPKLRLLDLTHCSSLPDLPLSLHNVTTLSKLFVVWCLPCLEESCRTNCERSSKWRKLNITFKDEEVHSLDKCSYFRYTFRSYML
jgi:Leucine-rich repeat (LRR) protein